MSAEVHAQRHKDLHQALDELAADYMQHMWTKDREADPPVFRRPSTITLLELMEWSYQQTIDPTPYRG